MEPWPAVTRQRATVSAFSHGHATHDLKQVYAARRHVNPLPRVGERFQEIILLIFCSQYCTRVCVFKP